MQETDIIDSCERNRATLVVNQSDEYVPVPEADDGAWVHIYPGGMGRFVDRDTVESELRRAESARMEVA